MNIKTATSEDVDAIVAIHLEAFPGFTLSLFGPRFLKLFYTAALLEDSGILLVAEYNGQVIGFVAGTIEPIAYYKKLFKTRCVSFALASLQGIILNPRNALHLLKMAFSALRYEGDKPKDVGKAALLSSIGVEPSSGSKGAGQELVAEFERACLTQGIARIYLTTDTFKNNRVNRFYERCGYKVFDNMIKSGGRHMNIYLKQIS